MKTATKTGKTSANGKTPAKTANRLSTVPSINIRSENNHYVVEMAVPGLKKEDFSIDVEGNQLTISCQKEEVKESAPATPEAKNTNDDHKFWRREYSYSRFSRALTLPENADAMNIHAKYIDGVLRLDVPKKAEAPKNQKIKVE